MCTKDMVKATGGNCPDPVWRGPCQRGKKSGGGEAAQGKGHVQGPWQQGNHFLIVEKKEEKFIRAAQCPPHLVQRFSQVTL